MSSRHGRTADGIGSEEQLCRSEVRMFSAEAVGDPTIFDLHLTCYVPLSLGMHHCHSCTMQLTLRYPPYRMLVLAKVVPIRGGAKVST